jgi:Branched-chain amino acid ABC-type transport system, permease components
MATTDLRRSLTELTGPLLVGLFLAVLSVVLAVDLARQVVVGTLAVSQLSSLVWSGVVDSLYIGLAAIGLSMTYSILQFANFAHGDLITTGAFTGWTVAYVIGGVGAADLGSRLLVDADGVHRPANSASTSSRRRSQSSSGWSRRRHLPFSLPCSSTVSCSGGYGMPTGSRC